MRSRREGVSPKSSSRARVERFERTFEQTVVRRSWRDEGAVDDLSRVARDEVGLLLSVG